MTIYIFCISTMFHSFNASDASTKWNVFLIANVFHSNWMKSVLILMMFLYLRPWAMGISLSFYRTIYILKLIADLFDSCIPPSNYYYYYYYDERKMCMIAHTSSSTLDLDLGLWICYTNRNKNYGSFRRCIKCTYIILICGNHEKLLFLLQNPTALNQRESWSIYFTQCYN